MREIVAIVSLVFGGGLMLIGGFECLHELTPGLIVLCPGLLLVAGGIRLFKNH